MIGMDSPGSRQMLSRFTWSWGQTVWKDASGTWSVQHTPDAATLDAAADLPAGDTSESGWNRKYVWIGGHRYTVSAAIQSEIQAAGVGGTFT